MSSHKSIKAIIDTNILISFLIGKKLHSIKDLISSRQIIIVLSEQLLLEFKMVTKRPKLKKYFPEQKVEELIDFFKIVGQIHEPNFNNYLNRDPKDNFLLDLAVISKADFLVTGDKDLLVLNPFKKTQILNPADFEAELIKSIQ
ncbi:MAG: putative toxin-antitoxin system toxin component, PIN family [Chitinophagaceae bacterium]